VNPQSLNRFGYVMNNPIRFNDPNGHMCSDPDDLWSPSCDGAGGPPPNTPAPLPSAPVVITDPEPLDDGLKQEKRKNADEVIEPDYYFRLGNESCDTKCQHILESLFVFGTMTDSIALGLNFSYALASDIAFLINPVIYAGMVVEFQWFSMITNSIGSLGGLTWIASGFVSGENYLEISANDGIYNVSGSLAQDTIATLILDGAGWFAPWTKEPNGAVAWVGLGVIYDIARNPFSPMLPTFIQPSFSFTIDTNSWFS
jgi:hypothetical protein